MSISPRRAVEAIFFVGDNHIAVRLDYIRDGVKLYLRDAISYHS